MPPLLTIAIPTYNRVSFLAYLFEQLVPALGECASERYEVLVLDNASTDGTDLLCEKYSGIISNFRTIRHDKNIGLSRNFEAAYRNALGEYVWLLCDDDAPEIHTISRLIAALDDYPDASCFLLNRNVHDIEMRALQRGNCLELQATLLLADWTRKIKFCEHFLTASCSVIRKEWCMPGFLAKAFSGTFCETLVLALTAMHQGPVVVLGDIYIRYRDGNSGSWNAYWPLIHVYYIPLVVNQLADDSGESMRSLIEHRKNSIFYDFCYLASTKNISVLRCVNRSQLREMYRFYRQSDIIYSFAFDLPIWVPRLFVLASSAFRLWKTLAKTDYGIWAPAKISLEMTRRYSRFLAKEAP